MKKQRIPRKRNAFTLIELLVVIAIITLLVSILVPSLTKAKELAKSTVCSANLRNFGLAFHTYAADNDGSLTTTGTDAGMWNSDSWISLLFNGGYIETKSQHPNWCNYLTLEDVFICPSDDRGSTEGNFWESTYGINMWVTGFVKNPAYRQTPYTLEEIPDAVRIPLLVDADSCMGGFPTIFSEPWINPWTNSPLHTFRHYHNNGDNFLFTDGHIQWITNLDDPGLDPDASRWSYVNNSTYFYPPDWTQPTTGLWFWL